MNCRSCGSANLWSFLDLGNQPLPRFPLKPDEKIPHAPLILMKCEQCHLVQLSESVARDLLFREFWYQSGISRTIKSDLEKIAEDGRREVGALKHGETVLDIGCNDGTLLSYFQPDLNRIGFEPAGNMAKLARQHGRIIENYFSAREYFRASFYKAKLIFAIAMFYDLEDPAGFCKEIAQCLDADGVFIVQQNYLPLMLENTAYDNVCHEHLTYFSLDTMSRVLAEANLQIFKVERNNINGGSFKTFISHTGQKTVEDSVDVLTRYESRLDLQNRKVYRDFSYRVRRQARILDDFLLRNNSVMIYGAGTRGATLFQFSTRYNPPKIQGAIDNNPSKHGHYYLDSKIPIISREQALQKPPEHFLVLPYHVADEIIEKEKTAFPEAKWIVPLPEFRVV